MKAREIILSIDINGSIIGVVPLTQGQHVIIDQEDVSNIGKYNWYAAYAPQIKGYYGIRTFYDDGKKTIRMHRQIMENIIDKKLKKREIIDHIDHNGLNNRHKNLRLCTARQNNQNLKIKKTSKYPGVSYDKNSKRWVANITFLDKKRHIDSFLTEAAAAKAYEMAQRLYCDENLVCKIKTISSYFVSKNFTPIWKIKEKNKTSVHKGVYYEKKYKKWRSQISVFGEKKYLGQFDTEIEAYDARYEFLKGVKNEKSR